MEQMLSLYLVQDDVTIRLVSGDERTLYECTCVPSQGHGIRVSVSFVGLVIRIISTQRMFAHTYRVLSVVPQCVVVV